jgi:hypothetical protein
MVYKYSIDKVMKNMFMKSGSASHGWSNNIKNNMR